MSLCLDYTVWGLNPWGYHLSNMLLHTANAILFFYIVKFIAETLLSPVNEHSAAITLAAMVGALSFSIHPLRVESVVWITERRDVLAGFFFLWTIWIYLRYASSRTGRILSYLTYFLALSAKATCLTFPVLLWILDMGLSRMAPRELFSPKELRKLIEKWPYMIISLPFSVLALCAAGSIAFYLEKTLWPMALSPFYELPAWVFHGAWSHVVLFGIFEGVSFFAIVKRWPYFLPAFLWYFVSLLPTSGLTQAGIQMAADRYSYIPCMSWALVLGLGLGCVLLGSDSPRTRHNASRISVISAVALISVLIALTRKQIAYWHDSYSLWEHALDVNPTSPIAHVMLGRVMMTRGDYSHAVTHFAQAAEFPFTSLDAHTDWGVALASMGQLQEALTHFQYVLTQEPNDLAAKRNYERALSLLHAKTHIRIGG
jgi:protein O-mannosyl-transferase